MSDRETIVDRLKIRGMVQSDADEICMIEQECFGSEAWPKEAFSNPGEDLFCDLVATVGGRVVGYISATCIDGDGEICSIAVARDYRRLGIAKRLISEYESREKPEQIFLEVRESNTAARGLYSSLGFIDAGIRRGYYDEPSEDAVVMRKVCRSEQ